MKTATLSQTGTPKMTGKQLKTILLPVLLILLAVGGYFGLRAFNTAQQAREAARIAEMQEQAAAAIADRVGVRVTQVMVTADGGLVDMRYEVIDPDKAIFLFDDLTVVPRMIAKNGTEIALVDVPHRHSVEAGLAYFILYRNVEGSIEPGDEVTVVVDGIHLEHFKVAP